VGSNIKTLPDILGVTITEKHLSRAKCRDRTRCTVALACHDDDRFPENFSVGVDTSNPQHGLVPFIVWPYTDENGKEWLVWYDIVRADANAADAKAAIQAVIQMTDNKKKQKLKSWFRQEGGSIKADFVNGGMRPRQINKTETAEQKEQRRAKARAARKELKAKRARGEAAPPRTRTPRRHVERFPAGTDAGV
jgi:hypothetical protein